MALECSEEEYQKIVEARRREKKEAPKRARKENKANKEWGDGKLEPFPKEKFLAFCNKLLIQSKDDGIVQFELLGSQRYILEEIVSGFKEGISTFVILKSRQLGASTFFLALDLFWAFFYPGCMGVFATHDEGSRDQFRNQIEVFLTGLPKTHKIGYEVNNRMMLVLKNLSMFRYLVAGGRTTTNKLGRSGGCNYCHATEVSFWGSEDDITALEQTFADRHRHRLYVYESTANGFNHYERMCRIAQESPAQKFIFVGWWRDERHEFPATHPLYLKYMPQGTKTRLSALEKERVKEVKKAYGFDITAGQIAWYRCHLENKCKGDQLMMDQEQPWCLIAGTKIGTNAGIIGIEKCRPGMMTSLGKIIAAMPMGEAEIWRARTSLGYEIFGTDNHPIININEEQVFIKNAFGETARLQSPKFANDFYTATWTDGIIECSVKITEDLGRLSGIFMGDGSITAGNGNHEFAIACYAPDEDFMNDTIVLVKNIFDVEMRKEFIKGNWARLRIGSKAICDTFTKLGMTRTNTGKTMRNVHVPDFIWKSPKTVVREFLRGLFETDGFNAYDSPRVVLFSKYEDFLRDVQILLLGFGITCQRVRANRKNSTHSYIANELVLRREEAIKFNKEIGFLSKRKCDRFKSASKKKKHNTRGIPMKMQDEIVVVENTGKREEVYNLTIENNHVFDANGILTHNTAEHAFITSGSNFFTGSTLTDASKEAVKHMCRPYDFRLSDEFTETQIYAVNSARDADLKLWELPVSGAKYIIGADPIFGSSDYHDNGVMSIFRAYADCCVQVGEYINSSISPHQFAWVIAFLAGLYGDVLLVLELNGPGMVVFQELKQLRGKLAHIPVTSDKADMRDCLRHMRDFLYSRSDSLSGNVLLQWKSSPDLRSQLLYKFHDGMTTRRLRLRSLHAIDEAKYLTIDEGYIGVPSSKNDDRVFGAALAYWGWDMRIRGRLQNRPGYTIIETQEREKSPTPTQIEGMVQRFLKNAEITFPR